VDARSTQHGSHDVTKTAAPLSLLDPAWLTINIVRIHSLDNACGSYASYEEDGSATEYCGAGFHVRLVCVDSQIDPGAVRSLLISGTRRLRLHRR